MPDTSKQSNPSKKPVYKKWWFWLLIVLIALCIAAGASGNNDTDSAASSSAELDVATQSENSSQTDHALGEINFTVSKVNNDTTGNWRVSVISEPIVMSDHAVAYYKKYVENDDEIHAVINFAKGTTTKITKSPLGILATTYEYVDGEEHDAKLLFSGDVLTEQYFDSQTGDEISVD